MKNSLILIFVINLLLVSCSNDENVQDPDPDDESELPAPVTYFTFRDNYSVQENRKGLYILVHDDQGNLLDYKPYENLVTLNFESTEPIGEKLSITVIKRIVDDPGNKTYELTTNLDVPKGSEWVLEPATITQYPALVSSGNSFTATIEGVPGVQAFWRTNTAYELGGGASSTTYPDGTDISISLDLFDGYPDFIITILDGSNQLKYLKHTYDGSDVVLNYEELQDPVAQYAVNLPENHSFFWLEVAGFPEDIPYHDYYGGILQRSIKGVYPEVPTNPLVFGYPGGFSRYRTVLSTSWDNKSYLRLQYGPPLNGLNIPNPTFSIVNPERSTFAFSTDAAYETARNTWRFGTGNRGEGTVIETIWHMDVPSGYPTIIGDLPIDILEALPELEIEELNYANTILKFSVEGGEGLSRNELTIYNN